VICQINDMRLKPRLASAAAATAITAMMLIALGLGFPRLAAASDDARVTAPAEIRSAAADAKTEESDS